MRVKAEEKEKVKKNIIKFLEDTKIPHNISEIARGIGKAPPTVSKFVKELSGEGKLSIIDKKSMKLVKLR
jgi:Mn-dependent DtxR family transcriptional regulator